MLEQAPAEVVSRYFAALASRDFELMRSLLADEDFRSRSPLSSYRDADAYIANISRVGLILERLLTRKIFVDGADVCTILDFQFRISELQTVVVAQWSTVRRGKIVSIETIFDASEYLAMFPE